jgi:hypothetical protein
MSLDTRIAAATEDLERHTFVDATAGLARLRQTDRRRRTTRAAVTAVAVVLLAAGAFWRLGDPPPKPNPAPVVPHVSNGVLLAMTATGETVVAAAGSLPHLPAGMPVAGHLAWSGDGIHLVHDTIGGTLVALDVETGGVRVLTSCPTPCLAGAAPDITRAAVASDGELRIRTPGDESTIPLPGLRPGAPVWSPDGTRIAFAEPTGLYVVKADGSWLRRYWDPAPGLQAVPPSWSPNGASLAYVAAKPVAGGDSHAEGFVLADYKLLVVDVASGSVKKIANLGRCTCEGLAPAVAWSPDGELVAFTGVGQRVGIYTVRVRGGEVTHVNSEQVGGALAWQPVRE